VPLAAQSLLVTRRHGYYSALGITAGRIPGDFADLTTPGAPIVRDPTVTAGGTALLRSLPTGDVPAVVATTLRLVREDSDLRRTIVVGTGPTGVPGVTRLLARGLRPVAAMFGEIAVPWTWDAATFTCEIQHPMTVWPTALTVRWAPL
jgi:hypothetical protein